MQAKTARRIVIALVASVVVGTAAIGAVLQSSLPTPEAAFATGEFVNGVPVYRLPTVNVTVSRKAALAEMAKEDAAAVARQRVEQLAVLLAQAGAVAVEADGEAATAFEARHQRGHVRLAPGDLAVGQEEHVDGRHVRNRKQLVGLLGQLVQRR